MYLEHLNKRLEVQKGLQSIATLSCLTNELVSSYDHDWITKGLGAGSGRGRPKGSKNGIRQNTKQEAHSNSATPASPHKLENSMAAQPKNNSAISTDGTVNNNKLTRGMKRIADLTDQNFHTEAIHAGAKLLGHPELTAQSKLLADTHKKVGYLSEEQDAKRRTVSDALQEHAKKVLSPSQYKSFYNSY